MLERIQFSLTGIAALASEIKNHIADRHYELTSKYKAQR